MNQPIRASAHRLISIAHLSVWMFVVTLPGWLPAGPIFVPNASFESPVTFFVTLNLDSWQRTPEPTDWNTNSSGDWSTLVGVFKNTAPGSADHIDNCDGSQATWLFAVPEVGLFQDFESMDWNDPAPSHAFNANFVMGRGYRLTVGILVGTAAGMPMQEGVTLDLSLYYRAGISNRIVVATTTVTNSSAIFSNSTHLLDFQVTVPLVQAGDPWAGKHIGIEFMSTVSSNMLGGYWDLDNVRLLEITPPSLRPIARNDPGFHLALQSEPGLRFELLATTNLLLPAASWTSLGLITNVSGEDVFTDLETNFAARYYQARWLP